MWNNAGFWIEKLNGAHVVKGFPKEGLNDVLVVEDVLEAGVNEVFVATLHTAVELTLVKFVNLNDERADMSLVCIGDS